MTDSDMKSTIAKLLAITALAFVIRLALLPLVNNPGINDPVHYFNLGRRLSEGQGLTIDYVWHYARMPVDLVHSTDNWMPLTGIAAAIGITVGGVGPKAALALFIIAGSLLPLLVYVTTIQLRQPDSTALIAAAFTAVLPELVLNSLRTDTTIVNALLVAAAAVLLRHGLDRRERLALVFSGIVFGLASLTRNDSIILLPLLIPYLIFVRDIRSRRQALEDAFLVSIAFAAVLLPWYLRNLHSFGMLSSPLLSRVPFMTDPREVYAYGMSFGIEALFERLTLAEILAKRIFEMGAAFKQMAVSLQLPLALAVPAGIGWLTYRGAGSRRLRIAPSLIWLAAFLIVYPLLMPVYNQAGSFKKAFLTVAPLLIPLGAIAIEKLVHRRRWRNAIVFVSLAWLAWSSYDLVRIETELADRFHASMKVLLEELKRLPDVTGDGELRLMSQDPFVLSLYGYSSVITPLATREDTLALAEEFEIDYLLMPAARPALDPIYLGEEYDPRFELASHIADAGEIPFELYRFVPKGRD